MGIILLDLDKVNLILGITASGFSIVGTVLSIFAHSRITKIKNNIKISNGNNNTAVQGNNNNVEYKEIHENNYSENNDVKLAYDDNLEKAFSNIINLNEKYFNKQGWYHVLRQGIAANKKFINNPKFKFKDNELKDLYEKISKAVEAIESFTDMQVSRNSTNQEFKETVDNLVLHINMFYKRASELTKKDK